MIDRHLWKDYLSATSLEGGKDANIRITLWLTVSQISTIIWITVCSCILILIAYTDRQVSSVYKIGNNMILFTVIAVCFYNYKFFVNHRESKQSVNRVGYRLCIEKLADIRGRFCTAEDREIIRNRFAQPATYLRINKAIRYCMDILLQKTKWKETVYISHYFP